MNFFPDEISDPGSWSDEKLEKHARIWCELPLLSVPAVMGDYDVQAHNDLIYIAGLVDDLSAAKAELTKELQDFKTEHGTYPSEPLMWLRFLAHSAEQWIPSRVEFSEPWPEDRAGVLLAQWRDEQDVAA